MSDEAANRTFHPKSLQGRDISLLRGLLHLLFCLFLRRREIWADLENWAVPGSQVAPGRAERAERAGPSNRLVSPAQVSCPYLAPRPSKMHTSRLCWSMLFSTLYIIAMIHAFWFSRLMLAMATASLLFPVHPVSLCMWAGAGDPSLWPGGARQPRPGLTWETWAQGSISPADNPAVVWRMRTEWDTAETPVRQTDHQSPQWHPDRHCGPRVLWGWGTCTTTTHSPSPTTWLSYLRTKSSSPLSPMSSSTWRGSLTKVSDDCWLCHTSLNVSSILDIDLDTEKGQTRGYFEKLELTVSAFLSSLHHPACLSSVVD